METKRLKRLIAQALREDVGAEDLTTRLTVPQDARCRGALNAKQSGVLSGMDVFCSVLELSGAQLDGWQALTDGGAFESGDQLASFGGLTAGVLAGERVALNFLQHLCGVATLTSQYVQAIDGCPAVVSDTRKTTPNLRALEKAAVIHGGGSNHRHGLYDGILIKENHVAAAGGIVPALMAAKAGAHHLMKVEIEVTNLEEFKQAMGAGADIILLDNMSVEEMGEAVHTRGDASIRLEASGNVNLDTIREIAETGVDVISVGAITHSAPACDLSLSIVPD